jgi:hypothetical protein
MLPPEQWQLIRPTAATDIYAVGCIAHALMTGHPPFRGDVGMLQQQHLNQLAPSLSALPPRARAIVSQMLRKAPEVRPVRSRCIEVLRSVPNAETEPGASASLALAEAVSEVALKEARREADRRELEERRRRRDTIFDEAVSDLTRIRDSLFATILEQASELAEKGLSRELLRFGCATFSFDTNKANFGRGIQKCYDGESLVGDGWGAHKRMSKWEIIALGQFYVEQRVDWQTYKRSANLIFGCRDIEAEYRWYEIAFWTLNGHSRDIPFCLDYVWDIDKVLSHGFNMLQLAHEPQAIDGEDEDRFIDYWTDIVAKAATGRLAPPASLPIKR